MAIFSTIGGWFSSGVKVLLWKYDEDLKKSDPVINGAVLIKGTPGKTVLSLEVKVIREHSYTVEEGEEKKTKTDTTVLGSVKWPGVLMASDLAFPLEFTAAEDREQSFSVRVAVDQELRHHATSAMGQMLSFGSSDRVEYYVVAEASVKGSILGASAREKLKVVE
jgi:hypothetical protein